MTKIQETIQLGDPVEHRGVVIAPLFPRRSPVAEYVTLEEALPLGFRVSEVDAAGSVPELRVANPLDAAVLLYDGEELVGAKQNRILNVSVLVGARSETTIPVSCVEEGRWHRRTSDFSLAPHAAHPALRRRKAERLAAAPLERGIAQGEVWAEVREAQLRHGVESPTHAISDVFDGRRDAFETRRAAFPLVSGQSGAVLALGDRLCLDYVSRPEAFARLYPKLLDGYLLDALERLDEEPAEGAAIEEFVAATTSAARSQRPSAGLGDDVRLRGERVVGSGLQLDAELVQLSAYSSDTQSTRTRIARPSRRS